MVRHTGAVWLDQAGGTAGAGFHQRCLEGKPVIGICNSWSELTHCNAHPRTLADAVRRGVWQAGGFPLEFPVMSLGEFLMRPTTMLFRNLMSMDVEESIRANPLDGVVLLGGCDKTVPALLMGAASANVPAILVTGGPQLTAHWRGEQLGSCTDCRRYQMELKAGRITTAEWQELQSEIVRSPGHSMICCGGSTIRLSTCSPMMCSCCVIAVRWAARACPNGGCCPSLRGCSARACGIWSGSAMPA